MARREALGKGIGALFSDQETDVKTPESLVVTNKSEVVSDEPEVKTSESSVITNEPEVVSKKSGIKTQESLVISDESEAVSEEPEVKTSEPSVITNKSEVASRKSDVKTPESLVITNKSEVVSNEPDAETPEPSVITNKSEVASRKSDVKTPESLVITNKSEVDSKKSGAITSDEKKKDQKQRSGNRGLKNRQRSPAIKTRQKIETVDQEILEQAITEAMESPRISTWSPLVMSALRYLQLTTARFSMSKEVSETLETAFREKYPELFERIEKELEER